MSVPRSPTGGCRFPAGTRRPRPFCTLQTWMTGRALLPVMSVRPSPLTASTAMGPAASRATVSLRSGSASAAAPGALASAAGVATPRRRQSSAKPHAKKASPEAGPTPVQPACSASGGFSAELPSTICPMATWFTGSSGAPWPEARAAAAAHCATLLGRQAAVRRGGRRRRAASEVSTRRSSVIAQLRGCTPPGAALGGSVPLEASAARPAATLGRCCIPCMDNAGGRRLPSPSSTTPASTGAVAAAIVAMGGCGEGELRPAPGTLRSFRFRSHWGAAAPMPPTTPPPAALAPAPAPAPAACSRSAAGLGMARAGCGWRKSWDGVCPNSWICST